MKRYFGVMPGLIALAVYYTTVCRSVWIGDSGEFSLALKTLGICHPPGYPLFTLIGRIFVSALPFVRATIAANLYNIVIASVTVTVIYYFFRRRLSQWSAALLSLIWAFTPIFWAETAGVEIYVFNLLLIVLTLLAIESGHNRKWLIAAYLFGLSLANHPSAMSILPVLIFLFIKEKKYRQWNLLPVILIILAITGSIYLYLLVRASCNPLSNWGNPENLRALIDHMTLIQYSGWIGHSWENIAVSCRLFFITILDSWLWIGIAATITGVIIGWIHNRSMTVCALLILTASLILSSSHQALDYEPFYILTMFASLLLISNIFIWLEGQLFSQLFRYGVYSAGLIACLLLLFTNYRGQDKSDYTLSEDYSKHILDSAGSGIIFTAGDINSFTTLYLRYVEGYRPAVEVYDRSIRLNDLLAEASKLAGQYISDYYSARTAMISFADRKMYLVKNHYIYEPDWLNIKEPLYSHGILYAVNEKPESSIEVLKYPVSYEPGDVLSRQLLVNLDLARGENLLSENPDDTSLALKEFNLALRRMDNEPRTIVLNNLGIYFRGAGFLDLALKTYKKALEKPFITPSNRRDILFNISNVYKDYGNKFLSLKDYHNAAKSYEEALRYDQFNPDLLNNLAIIYGQVLGDTARAGFYIEKYRSIMSKSN